MDGSPKVLVVSADHPKRDELGERLEARGYEVTICPGPLGPRYVCVGVRCGVCPLVETVDAVVVDGWLSSDEQRRGVPSWHLARTYWDAGLPVVLLVGPDGLLPGITNDRLVAMPRAIDAEDVAAAIGELVHTSAA